MQNKLKNIVYMFVLMVVFCAPVMAEEEDVWADKVSADAVSEYQVNGSVFEKITSMEQEKVLMEIEKERAQMDLELDRLAAEKIKLRMEIEQLSSNAEEQKQALVDQKAKLDEEAAQLEEQKRVLANQQYAQPVAPTRSKPIQQQTKPEEKTIGEKYKLIDIIGIGSQLQATVQDLENNQRKKINVGKILDGYTVKSISLDEGVMFINGDVTETLNIGKEN